jgi:hypothetical protein
MNENEKIVTIHIDEYNRLLRYICYLQQKCDTINWHYNKYETWCEINAEVNNLANKQD